MPGDCPAAVETSLEVPVLVRDRDDYLELTVTERLAGDYAAGDTRFAVRARVSGPGAVLTAESSCWVEWRALAAFAEQLRRLEERRQGSASLESISPGELRLEIRSTDGARHVAAVGQVGRRLGAGGLGPGEPYWSAVSFRVAFCPSELPGLVCEFSALARRP